MSKALGHQKGASRERAKYIEGISGYDMTDVEFGWQQMASNLSPHNIIRSTVAKGSYSGKEAAEVLWKISQALHVALVEQCSPLDRRDLLWASYTYMDAAAFNSSPLGITTLVRQLPSSQMLRPISIAQENIISAIYLTEVAAIHGIRSGKPCSTLEFRNLFETARQAMTAARNSEAFLYGLLIGELVISGEGNARLPERDVPDFSRILLQLEREKQKESPSFHKLLAPDEDEFEAFHSYSLNDLFQFEEGFVKLVFPTYRILQLTCRTFANKMRKKSGLDRNTVKSIISDYESSPETIAPVGDVEFWRIYGRENGVGRRPFLTIPEGMTFAGLFMLARSVPIRVTEEVLLKPLGPRTKIIRQQHANTFEEDVRSIARKAGYSAKEISESECRAGQIDCVAIHKNRPLCLVMECKTTAFVPELRQYLLKVDTLREWEQKLDRKMHWVQENMHPLEQELLGRVTDLPRRLIGIFVSERPFLAQASASFDLLTIYDLNGYLEAIQQIVQPDDDDD